MEDRAAISNGASIGTIRNSAAPTGRQLPSFRNARVSGWAGPYG